MTPTVVLTVAGSDSGGGAGIQADLKTFAALGLHGTSAVTALTAQNTAAVLGVLPVDPDFVVAQIEAVLGDLAVAAVKTGMLAGPGTVTAVADLAARGMLPNLVVDPVLVSSSGHALMAGSGVEAYRTDLLPYARVATPNLRETAVLSGLELGTLAPLEARVEAARLILGFGPAVVVVKGGHLDHDAADVVVSADGVSVLGAERIATGNDHGTGCSLSAAIAARLARGDTPVAAVTAAKEFVRRGLAGAAGWRLGAGHGPIDHFGWGDGATDPA